MKQVLCSGTIPFYRVVPEMLAGDGLLFVANGDKLRQKIERHGFENIGKGKCDH